MQTWISTITAAQARNYFNTVVSAIGGAAAAGLINKTDAATVTGALGQVWDGLAQAEHGVMALWVVLTPVVAFLMAHFAGKAAQKASDPVEQAKALVQAVPGTKIVTTQALADATRGNTQIVSINEATVVPQ